MQMAMMMKKLKAAAPSITDSKISGAEMVS
jgi:hypothetical protein